MICATVTAVWQGLRPLHVYVDSDVTELASDRLAPALNRRLGAGLVRFKFRVPNLKLQRLNRAGPRTVTVVVSRLLVLVIV